ncbi:MAG: sensor histidine kinase [Actinomycetota bacterium]
MASPRTPAGEEGRTARWTDALLLRGANVRSPFVVILIVLGLLLCFTVTYRLGGAGSVAPGWFSLVVLIGAARFRYVGVILVSAAATLLTGPLMPLDVATDTPQHVGVWVGRGLTFLVIGLVTAALVDRVQAARQRELDLAKEERDLAVRKAAVIATVSHEFRTPLTTIVGVARTLEVHGMVSEAGLPLLDGLLDATRRMVDLVTMVGAVMEHDESFVRPEPIVMRDLFDHVIEQIGVRNPRGRVSVDIDPRAELVVCDREMLGQLLRHIIENAVKFSPPGEMVEVRVARARTRLLVRVSDRGPGIDEDFLETWDPFSQGDGSMTRVRQGLGLGLFAASRLAEILGGSIAFRRGHTGGTLVVIEVVAPDPGAVMSGPDLQAVAG